MGQSPSTEPPPTVQLDFLISNNDSTVCFDPANSGTTACFERAPRGQPQSFDTSLLWTWNQGDGKIYQVDTGPTSTCLTCDGGCPTSIGGDPVSLIAYPCTQGVPLFNPLAVYSGPSLACGAQGPCSLQAQDNFFDWFTASSEHPPGNVTIAQWNGGNDQGDVGNQGLSALAYSSSDGQFKFFPDTYTAPGTVLLNAQVVGNKFAAVNGQWFSCQD